MFNSFKFPTLTTSKRPGSNTLYLCLIRKTPTTFPYLNTHATQHISYYYHMLSSTTTKQIYIHKMHHIKNKSKYCTNYYRLRIHCNTKQYENYILSCLITITLHGHIRFLPCLGRLSPNPFIALLILPYQLSTNHILIYIKP